MTAPRYGRVNLSIAAIVASALGEPVPDRVPLNGEAVLRPRLAGGGVEVGRGADGEEVQVPLPVSCQVLDGVLTQGDLPHVTLLVPTDAWYWQISFSDFAVGDTPIFIEPFAFPVVEAAAANLADDEFAGVNIAQFAAAGWHSGAVPPAGSKMVAEMSELLVDAQTFATQSEIRVNRTEQHVDRVGAQVATALDQANVFAQDQVPPYLQQAVLNDTYAKRYRVYDVVVDFGADNTGVTSATAALNAAITAANSTGGKCVIYLPNGTYDLTAGTAVPVTAPDVVFLGAGDPQTMVKCATGTVFQFGTTDTGCYRAGVSGMRFWYPTTPANTTCLFRVVRGGSMVFDRIGLDQVNQLARLGTSTTQANNITFSHIRGQTANINGSVVIDAVAGSTLNLDDIIVYNNCGFPGDGTIGKFDPHPAMDTRFLRFGQRSWDTLITNMVHINRYNISFDMAPVAGAQIGNFWFTSVIADYGKTNGLRFAPASGGNINGVWVVAGWYVATDGRAIETVGPGMVGNVNFTGTVGRQSGKSNWFFGAGSVLENVRLTNCYGVGANRLMATNTGSDQDDLVIWATGVSVMGGEFGMDGFYTTDVAGTDTRYGLNIAADVSSYSVTDATFDGKTGRAVVPMVNSAPSKSRRLAGNRGKNNTPMEYALSYTLSTSPPAGVPPLPATTVEQFHTGPTTDTLYVYGGTVTSIQHNNMEIAAAGPATIILRPGDSWKLIYSVAPTVRRMVGA